MPGFLAAMFEGPMTVDHDSMAEESRKMAVLFTGARIAIVTTPLGTELTLDLERPSGNVDAGLIAAASLGNLPAGEAFMAPVEGRPEGKAVISPKCYTRLGEQMTIHFKQGLVWDIEGGGEVAEEFRRMLELASPGRRTPRRNLAELGIGTNPKARSAESDLESEKTKGTVHVAIGDNSHIGGVMSADLHEDFILWEPNLSLDGPPVIEGGRWLVQAWDRPDAPSV